MREINSKLFKPDLIYMTRLEAITFKRMVNKGDITFFRTSQCAKCKSIIIKGKQYCSAKCAEIEEYENDEEDWDE